MILEINLIWKYYHAENASDLGGIFDDASQGTIDLATDTDTDGLSNYHEKKGYRTNIGWIYSNFEITDTDGYGLKDGEEVIYADGYFNAVSNPNIFDTDNDGINDKLDPEPMVYTITDRTLALSAQLSYKNLESSIGESIGDKGQPELSNFRINDANNSSWLTLNDFFDEGLGSVSIRISRSGKKDALIFAMRGTEMTNDTIRDFSADLILGLDGDSKQSREAYDEYRKLSKENPNADIFLAGHSLGGRLVQDVLYKVYDDNDGIFRLFKDNLIIPTHSFTFNALGYNKVVYFKKGIFKIENVNKINNNLNNYYYKEDLVGDGFGHSLVFKRLGTDVGPWIARDENGNVTDGFRFPGMNMLVGAVHGIELWCNDISLKYPQTTSIY